ncbi:hypothetical protein FA15DRAFT_625850 [Coprinopsis marcescibilis]|uniref:DUF6697 domain-containing protein n=1 Tax=Coprinopsis marcescibilis TaxID=230819 RepID=A0A5C3KIY9_COPMA|nr:hypothetical protein FA15DRAFT_625850 [Coprinopsis marcescibilis]
MTMALSKYDILKKRYSNFTDDDGDAQARQIAAHLNFEQEFLLDTGPFRAVEMAVEIQIERKRVAEAMRARDALVDRLADAYMLLRRHSDVIEYLQEERKASQQEKVTLPTALSGRTSPAALPADSAPFLDPKAHIAALEATVDDLRDLVRYLKMHELTEEKAVCHDPPPHYEEGVVTVSTAVQTEQSASDSVVLADAVKAGDERAKIQAENTPPFLKHVQHEPPPVENIVELINARNDLLYGIPLPDSSPDMTLDPILLPPQVTLHEFLNGAPVPLRNTLANYRILQSVTTSWCPEREEHGFMYTPLFRCCTNPRTVTAHRWNAVDVIGRMAKPTECFYNNEGTWYYAGSYRAFMIDVVSTKEWESLSNETTSALIKETLAARKNCTPQTTYETGQLYAAGALKLACVGLQCVGFNQEVYHSVSELSAKLLQSAAAVAAAAVSAAAACASSRPLSVPSPIVATTALATRSGNISPAVGTPAMGTCKATNLLSSSSSPSPNKAGAPGSTNTTPTGVKTAGTLSGLSTPGSKPSYATISHPLPPKYVQAAAGGGSPGGNVHSHFPLLSKQRTGVFNGSPTLAVGGILSSPGSAPVSGPSAGFGNVPGLGGGIGTSPGSTGMLGTSLGWTGALSYTPGSNGTPPMATTSIGTSGSCSSPSGLNGSGRNFKASGAGSPLNSGCGTPNRVTDSSSLLHPGQTCLNRITTDGVSDAKLVHNPLSNPLVSAGGLGNGSGRMLGRGSSGGTSYAWNATAGLQVKVEGLWAVRAEIRGGGGIFEGGKGLEGGEPVGNGTARDALGFGSIGSIGSGRIKGGDN